MKRPTHAAMAIVLVIGLLLTGLPVFAEDAPPDPVEIITVPEPTDPAAVPEEPEPSETDETPPPETDKQPEEPTPGSDGESGGSVIMPLGIIDETPPVLNNVTLNKTQVPAGDTITINVTATDDISGVDYVDVNFLHEDGQTYIWERIYSWNSLTLSLTLNNHQKVGKYTLSRVWIYDKANNYQEYMRNPAQWDLDNGVLPLTMMVAFTVTSNAPDTTPPVLTNVTMDKSSVAASEEITFTVSATDDISGVSYVGLTFKCAANDRYIGIGMYADEDGVLKTTYPIPDYQQPGVYELDSVYMYDKANNTISYYHSSYGSTPVLPVSRQFTVTNVYDDVTPPTLNSITLDKYEVETPGSVTVTVNTSDDISGTDYAHMTFSCDDNNKQFILYAYSDYSDYSGILTTVNTISVYQLPGTYRLTEIYLRDRAYNYQYYKETIESWDTTSLPLTQFVELVIINDGTYDFASNTNNPNLANEIAQLPDGSTVGIDYGSNGYIGWDVFSAIQGKDIDMVLVGNGIEWVFNGQDIDNPKDIALNVEIAPIDYSGAENAAEILQALQGAPGVVLSFPNNGQLPGKAKMRVKADSEFAQYLGVEDLYVYYFNNQTNQLELVKANVNVTHDGFIEFEITHNSAFVITNQLIQSTGKPNPNPDPDPDPNPNPGPNPNPNPNPGSTASSFGGSSRSSSTSSASVPVKSNVTANAVVREGTIVVKGQTKLGFVKVTYMGEEITGVKVRKIEGGVAIVLPDAFLAQRKTKNANVRIEFANAYVSVKATELV